jgi:hypothetical protein
MLQERVSPLISSLLDSICSIAVSPHRSSRDYWFQITGHVCHLRYESDTQGDTSVRTVGNNGQMTTMRCICPANSSYISPAISWTKTRETSMRAAGNNGQMPTMRCTRIWRGREVVRVDSELATPSGRHNKAASQVESN